MSAFVFFLNASTFQDPFPGEGGDVQWYRAMNGAQSSSGAPYMDFITLNPTKFLLSGDPVMSQDGSAGWVDGIMGLVPGDRRILMACGPFTMAAGDTQEMVVALTAGLGYDRLSSVTVLRLIDDGVQSIYNSLTGVGPVVGASEPAIGMAGTVALVQNYPNPFNSSTNIRYELPGSSMVRLSVYDLLGREVSVLVNERKDAGVHDVKFHENGLSSGVYFYGLTAGSLTQTRRLVLVR